MIIHITAARLHPTGGGFYINIRKADIDRACQRIGIKRSRLITTKPRKSTWAGEGSGGHNGPLVDVLVRDDGWEFEYSAQIRSSPSNTARVVFPKRAIDDLRSRDPSFSTRMARFDVDIDIDLVEKPFDTRRR